MKITEEIRAMARAAGSDLSPGAMLPFVAALDSDT
jgi:hypothetical protein